MQMPVRRSENDAYDIGQKIRARREELGLSQDDLADRMGTNRVAVSRHENGINEMSICTLCQYADALETTIQQLSPDRFREPGMIGSIFSTLSEASRQAILNMMTHLQHLESKA